MFGRLFLILVLLAVSFYVVKYLRTMLDETQKRIDKNSQNSNNNEKSNKKLMVKRQACGLHIPEKEAIKQGDNIFCSLEHAKQGL